ncbi:MAG TPA: hypothetical protein VEP90_01895, partial [Methylomirabilota bacterium]|nr:hypothetical protein [Methylomirabilota bacterium]
NSNQEYAIENTHPKNAVLVPSISYTTSLLMLSSSYRSFHKSCLLRSTFLASVQEDFWLTSSP